MIAAARLGASVTVRKAWPEDQAFVAKTFAEQLARGNNALIFTSTNHVTSAHCSKENAVVDRVLDSETTRVLVACDVDGRIAGWLCYAAIPRVRAVLFVYVRNKQRLGGVARALVDAAWPSSTRPWVHGGLRGGSTKSLLQRFAATEMDLTELL